MGPKERRSTVFSPMEEAAIMALRLPQSDEAADDRPDPILRLCIDDDGHTLLID